MPNSLDPQFKENERMLGNGLPQQEALQLIPETLARKYNAIPLEVYNGTLRVAMSNPADIFALEALATQSRKRIEPDIASPEDITAAIDFNYKALEEIEQQISSIPLPESTSEDTVIVDSVNDTPIVKALTLIIDEAVKARASDIHLQPQSDNLRVRYRIDGTLHDMLSLPIAIANPICSRIKILANMNIADHLRPQDGQFSVTTKGRSLDIRVGTAPSVYGEMVALRLLDKSRVAFDLSELGFLPESLKIYEQMLKAPYGMLLISGPTGSGKTTSLYASLNRLDRKEQNIVTIEDPVEYRFNNINQVQVNARADLTFSRGLDPLLRLDPDIILVGEIRDAETAEIAIQSALTGHLVLSSIHANDSIGAVFRLLDLGVEPFMVSSALIGVVAQRMVRRICPHCSQDTDVPIVEQIAYEREIGEKKTSFLYGTGCKSCSNTGYYGRTGIFEILKLSEALKLMLLEGSSTTQMRTQAIKEGMLPLIKDGMLKAAKGITAPSEVLRNAFTSD